MDVWPKVASSTAWWSQWLGVRFRPALYSVLCTEVQRWMSVPIRSFSTLRGAGSCMPGHCQRAATMHPAGVSVDTVHMVSDCDRWETALRCWQQFMPGGKVLPTAMQLQSSCRCAKHCQVGLAAAGWSLPYDCREGQQQRRTAATARQRPQLSRVCWGSMQRQHSLLCRQCMRWTQRTQRHLPTAR